MTRSNPLFATFSGSFIVEPMKSHLFSRVLDRFVFGGMAVCIAALVFLLDYQPTKAQVLEIPVFENYPPKRHVFTFDRLYLEEAALPSMTATRDLREELNACKTMVDWALGHYLQDWPEFAQIANSDPDWRRAWAHHFARHEYRHHFDCYEYLPAQIEEERASYAAIDARLAKGIKPSDNPVPVWCGRWTAPPVDTRIERAWAAIIDLALNDLNRLAVNHLANSNANFIAMGVSDLVALNADVALYLQERQRLLTDDRFGRFPLFDAHRPHYALQPETLGTERRNAVIDAAQRGDAGWVVATTGPCRSRLQIIEHHGYEVDEFGDVRAILDIDF